MHPIINLFTNDFSTFRSTHNGNKFGKSWWRSSDMSKRTWPSRRSYIKEWQGRDPFHTLKPTIFSVKFVLEKNENKKKRSQVWLSSRVAKGMLCYQSPSIGNKLYGIFSRDWWTPCKIISQKYLLCNFPKNSAVSFRKSRWRRHPDPHRLRSRNTSTSCCCGCHSGITFSPNKSVSDIVST